MFARTYDAAGTYRSNGTLVYDGVQTYRFDGARTYEGARTYLNMNIWWFSGQKATKNVLRALSTRYFALYGR